MIKKLIDKFLTREIITYVIAGVLTTGVNMLVSYIFYNVLSVDENTTNIVAWIVAVLFAFVVNNFWVFRSGHEGLRQELYKLCKFIVARLASFVFEIGIPYVFVTLLSFNYWVIKVITSVVVIVLNYILSKFLVFIKRKDQED